MNLDLQSGNSIASHNNNNYCRLCYYSLSFFTITINLDQRTWSSCLDRVVFVLKDWCIPLVNSNQNLQFMEWLNRTRTRFGNLTEKHRNLVFTTIITTQFVFIDLIAREMLFVSILSLYERTYFL